MSHEAVHPDRHPLAAAQGAYRWTIGMSIGAAATAALWGMWPLGDSRVELPAPPEAPAIAHGAGARSVAMLDLTAFGAPIWDPPPPPVVAPKAAVVAAPPPPPPLRLQLLGIVRDALEDGSVRYVAAVYDESADKLLMLTDGDTIGRASGAGPGARITRVTAEGVELTDQSGLRRLALREPAQPLAGLPLLGGSP